MSPSRVRTDVSKGKAGFVYGTDGNTKFAADGQDGNVKHFTNNDLPPHLRYNVCFPELNTIVSQSDISAKYYPGGQVVYMIRTTNVQSATATGVQLEVRLPAGFSFTSAKASYTGDAGGPLDLNNQDPTAAKLILGDFTLFSGDEVFITLTAKIDCKVLPGTYHVSAQALSPDPLRTMANPDRKVSPVINAFPGTLTSYETSTSAVPGSNYNGNLPGSSAEDVQVIAWDMTGNLIHAPQTTVFCLQGDPGLIQGDAVSGGLPPYSYQWQESTNGQIFTDITNATAADFDPPLLTDFVYYRRNVFMLGCINQLNTSNVVFMNVVKPLPVPDFLVPDVCLKDGTAYFKNTTDPADEDLDHLSYVWDFGDPQASAANPNTSTQKDGAHLYTKTGNYTITLRVYKEGACPQMIQKTFRVNGSIPKAGFNVLGPICGGQELAFEDKAIVDFGEITRIEWYFEDRDPTQLQVDLQPEKRNAAPRIYKHQYAAFHSPATKPVTVRMVVYSGASCQDELRMPLVLLASPELSFDPIPDVCRNTPAFKLSQAKEIWGIAGSGKYFGAGVSPNGNFNPDAAGAGTHTLRYVFTADNGCVVEKSQQVTVLPVPVADAGENLSVLEGGTVQLAMDAKEPIGTAAARWKYQWSPAIFLDRSDVFHPICSPGSDQTYTLAVTNAENCVSTDQVTVRVMLNPVIPNTFSPNGDGINDEWTIKYLDSYPKATIQIFNRYGTKVFNGDAKSKSWDGKSGGQDLPVGTYYYVIDPHNGRKILSGSITILR